MYGTKHERIKAMMNWSLKQCLIAGLVSIAIIGVSFLMAYSGMPGALLIGAWNYALMGWFAYIIGMMIGTTYYTYKKE